MLTRYEKLALSTHDIWSAMVQGKIENTFERIGLKQYYNDYFIPRVRRYIPDNSNEKSAQQLCSDKIGGLGARVWDRMGLDSPLKEVVKSVVPEKEIYSTTLQQFSLKPQVPSQSDRVPRVTSSTQKSSLPKEKGLWSNTSIGEPVRPLLDFLSAESILSLQLKMKEE